MRREIETVKHGRGISGDRLAEPHRNRRDKAARAEGIKKEHRAFRRAALLTGTPFKENESCRNP